VIARLNKEVENLKEKGKNPSFNQGEDVWETVSARIGTRAKELAHYRKKERQTQEITKDISAMTCTASHTLHQSDKPGVLCVDIKGHHIVTGGNDKNAKVPLIHPIVIVLSHPCIIVSGIQREFRSTGSDTDCAYKESHGCCLSPHR
jgi:hypothetical protein